MADSQATGGTRSRMARNYIRGAKGHFEGSMPSEQMLTTLVGEDLPTTTGVFALMWESSFGMNKLLRGSQGVAVDEMNKILRARNTTVEQFTEMYDKWVNLQTFKEDAIVYRAVTNVEAAKQIGTAARGTQIRDKAYLSTASNIAGLQECLPKFSIRTDTAETVPDVEKATTAAKYGFLAIHVPKGTNGLSFNAAVRLAYPEYKIAPFRAHLDEIVLPRNSTMTVLAHRDIGNVRVTHVRLSYATTPSPTVH